MKRIKSLLALAAVGFSGVAHAGFIPAGIQSDVSLNTVSNWGWSECHRSQANGNQDIANVLSSCKGKNLMMGVFDASSNLYKILGAGTYDAVTAITYVNYNSDNNGTILNNWSNGLNFYRTKDQGSWGFTTNTRTELNSADIFLLNGVQTQNGQAESTLSKGLSFHISGPQLTQGWGYNATGSSFTSTDWTDYRVFLVQNAEIPEPATLALLGMGLIGIGALRRRSAG